MREYLVRSKYLEFIKEKGRVPTKEEFVDEMKICSRSWFYKVKKELED